MKYIKDHRHPEDITLGAYIPPDLHKAVKEKLAQEGMQLRELMIWFLEKWTGHKVERYAERNPPDVGSPKG